MTSINCILSDQTLQELNEKATSFSISKDKLIETALLFYFEHIDKKEYIKSYQQVSKNKAVIIMAEEGLNDYLNQIEDK